MDISPTEIGNPNTGGTVTVTSGASADLSVVKSDDNDPIFAGGSTEYTVVITNDGPDAVTGAALDDVVSFPGGTFSVSGESLVFSGGGTGTLVIEADGPDVTGLSLANGETATLTFTVTADTGNGTITNTATASGGTPSDPNNGNDTAVETTTVVTTAVTNTNDDGDGSLRQAILNSNAVPGLDTITFAIGTGAQTISVGSTTSTPLPAITDVVIIDGTTQPGFAGTPLIELDGTSAGAGANGLEITAGGSTV